MVSPVFSIFWDQIKVLKPSFVSKKPHFNFITVHYFWVIGLTLLASVLIYGTAHGDLAYIDALFFAAGANTQAGLNPVDVNNLNTFQQVVIMLCSMMANPITINSFVVFLRLFWFEKKFQHIVREARNRRGTISKSKSHARTESVEPEMGVNGRHITVMYNNARSRMTNDGIVLESVQEKVPNGSTPNGSSPNLSPNATSPKEDPVEDSVEDPAQNEAENQGPGIRFAGTVKRSDGVEDDLVKQPRRRTDEEHIAILERQRNTTNDDILRIPGPRDVERGLRPSRVDEGDPEEPEPLSPRGRRYSEGGRERGSKGQSEKPERPKGKGITIQEPAKKPSKMDEINDDARAFFNVLTPFKLRKPRAFNASGDNLHHDRDAPLSRMRRRQTLDTIRNALSRDKEDEAPYLSWQPTLGRNSQFHDMSEEQREELGGIEYRSLKTLSLILTLYFWGFWILAIICLTPWIIHSPYGSIVDKAGQSRAWWGIFTGNSAFMDLGFTLTPDSMNSFNTAVFPLLVMSFFIVIGNTGFPVMLRFIIWVTSLYVPRHSGLWEELRFLLDHPRRCFTLLFPSAATWWLFWLLVILNGIDLIFFIVLDLGNGPISALSAGHKVLDGLFQAASTRTAGFSCVNLAYLHPAVQTSYLIMMYISVFPIAISVRRTNVYEEKSLGIYQEASDDDETKHPSSFSYVGAHLRRQLSFDLWFIFIGFFILSISEGRRLQTDDFSMFAVLFEIVSAYGTVGMSLGYPTVNASLSSQFSVVGKLVMIGMQIRGRHRGLPYGLDRAVILPNESGFRKEAKMSGGATIPRRNSTMSVATDGRSIRRGRSRSVDNRLDRSNSNILTQFLHPGPAVPHLEVPHYDAPPHHDPNHLRRAVSDPTVDDDGEATLGPAFDPYRAIPRRSEQYSMSRRSINNASLAMDREEV
ncbi:Low-affinity potassium transport protein [Cytospora mali]|uniref:Potassium transport protein n=1 Tax=Cytospora mali TaxID=578113 RepID=A0A194URN0_CYTMA|nr:Low-affinity potassium transport protein [Valsa mali var. pyri (nom. inval.)]